jgi:hypothetical protein
VAGRGGKREGLGGAGVPPWWFQDRQMLHKRIIAMKQIYANVYKSDY